MTKRELAEENERLRELLRGVQDAPPDLADELDAALGLLRKLQWRGDGFSCISCGNAHRWGCKPDCEVTAMLSRSDRACNTTASPARTRKRPIAPDT